MCKLQFTLSCSPGLIKPAQSRFEPPSRPCINFTSYMNDTVSTIAGVSRRKHIAPILPVRDWLPVKQGSIAKGYH